MKTAAIVTVLLLSNGEASRTSIRDIHAVKDFSQGGKVCSITERAGHTKYGLKVRFPMPNGCRGVTCQQFHFLTHTVPNFIKAQEEGADCHCHALNFSESGNEQTELFSFMKNPLDPTCSSAACWTKYSDALFLAKRVKRRNLSPAQRISSPNHWQVRCEDGSPMAEIPTVGAVVGSLLANGGKDGAKAASKIQRVVKVTIPKTVPEVQGADVGEDSTDKGDGSASGVTADSSVSTESDSSSSSETPAGVSADSSGSTGSDSSTSGKTGVKVIDDAGDKLAEVAMDNGVKVEELSDKLIGKTANALCKSEAQKSRCAVLELEGSECKDKCCMDICEEYGKTIPSCTANCVKKSR